MTTADQARAALDTAQKLLEQVEADNERFAEILTWLGEAADRAEELAAYYAGDGQDHIAAVLADDPEAVTPPVANEDSAWEAISDHEDGVLRLLRAATEELTDDLD